MVSLNASRYARGMSEGERSSSAASADVNFSPLAMQCSWRRSLLSWRRSYLSKTLTHRAGSTVSGRSGGMGGAVDAGVRRSHPPVVGTSGDSSESPIGEERNNHVCVQV